VKPVWERVWEPEASGFDKRRKTVTFDGKGGGAERDRTADLVIANDALSQLSYSPSPVPRAWAREDFAFNDAQAAMQSLADRHLFRTRRTARRLTAESGEQ
jgi:hypothetical protein